MKVYGEHEPVYESESLLRVRCTGCGREIVSNSSTLALFVEMCCECKPATFNGLRNPMRPRPQGEGTEVKC